MKKYLIALVLVAVVVAGVAYWQINKSPSNLAGEPIASSTSPVACTEEAKVCPDGSAVGRQGPNCEFAECSVAKVVPGTEDWKIYKNNELGFEFKYPSNWFVSISDDNFLMFTKKYVGSNDRIKQGEEQFLAFSAGQKIVDSRGNEVSKEDYLKFFYPGGCSFGVCYKNEEKEVNGLTVFKHEVLLPNEDIRYVFFYGNKVYQFVLYGLPSGIYKGLSKDAYDPNDFVIVEKILSTIKFK